MLPSVGVRVRSPSYSQAERVPLLVQPHGPASSPSGQRFISPVASPSDRPEALLEPGRLFPSLPFSLSDDLSFSLSLFKALVFSEVTSFPPQNQSGEETKILSPPR